jgi:hypothetical protein
MSATRGTIARAFALCAFSTLLPLVVDAQEQRPSLSAGRITGEILVGAYVGIGGFFLGRFVGDQISDVTGVSSEATRDHVRLVSGLVVAGGATAGAVYGIGSIGDQAGDFGATALGATVGMTAALGLARVVLGPGGRPREGMSTAGRWALANAIALLPAAGAAVGFASTRRYQ